MSKFKVGQEVIFTKGDLVDVKGVVHNPYWQASETDWPEVVVDYTDGENTRRLLVNIDDVRPAVDPYEYRLCQRSEQGFWFPLGDSWWDLRLVEGDFERRKDEALRYSTGKEYKIVRRLKAGEPEDYNV